MIDLNRGWPATATDPVPTDEQRRDLAAYWPAPGDVPAPTHEECVDRIHVHRLPLDLERAAVDVIAVKEHRAAIRARDAASRAVERAARTTNRPRPEGPAMTVPGAQALARRIRENRELVAEAAAAYNRGRRDAADAVASLPPADVDHSVPVVSAAAAIAAARGDL